MLYLGDISTCCRSVGSHHLFLCKEQVNEKQSGFQLSVLKPELKQSLQPIRADVNSAFNQSEFETNASNRRKARENACERVTIGFGFASH